MCFSSRIGEKQRMQEGLTECPADSRAHHHIDDIFRYCSSSIYEIIDIIASPSIDAINQSHQNSGAWNRFAIMEHTTTI